MSVDTGIKQKSAQHCWGVLVLEVVDDILKCTEPDGGGDKTWSRLDY